MNIFRQNFLCDVILVVNDVEANAHKCVLAACSPYFYAMFANFEEKKLDRVVIKDIDFLAIELLIEYMYTSEILVTENNVQVFKLYTNFIFITINFNEALYLMTAIYFYFSLCYQLRIS